MLRTVSAAVAGYVLIGLLVVATDQVFAWSIPGFALMTVPPDRYFVISLITDSLYSLAGGYLCAVIARDRTRHAILWLIVLGEIIGLGAQVALWDTVPHWFGIGLLALYAPAVWLGGRMRVKPAPPRSFSATA